MKQRCFHAYNTLRQKSGNFLYAVLQKSVIKSKKSSKLYVIRRVWFSLLLKLSELLARKCRGLEGIPQGKRSAVPQDYWIKVTVKSFHGLRTAYRSETSCNPKILQKEKAPETHHFVVGSRCLLSYRMATGRAAPEHSRQRCYSIVPQQSSISFSFFAAPDSAFDPLGDSAFLFRRK